MSQPSEGFKHDASKLRMDLIPPEAIEALARICTYGCTGTPASSEFPGKASPYPDRNWEQGMDWGRVFAALNRHLWAWWRGEDLDPESGYPHLEHALWNAAALVTYRLRGVGNDSRLGKPVLVSDSPQEVRDAVAQRHSTEAMQDFHRVGKAMMAEKIPDEFQAPTAPTADIEMLADTCHKHGADLYPVNDPVNRFHAPRIATDLLMRISAELNEAGIPARPDEFNILERIKRLAKLAERTASDQADANP